METIKTSTPIIASNSKDFGVWAKNHGWFKLKTAFFDDSLSRDFWMTPNGTVCNIVHDDEGLISGWNRPRGIQ